MNKYLLCGPVPHDSIGSIGSVRKFLGQKKEKIRKFMSENSIIPKIHVRKIRKFGGTKNLSENSCPKIRWEVGGCKDFPENANVSSGGCPKILWWDIGGCTKIPVRKFRKFMSENSENSVGPRILGFIRREFSYFRT